MKNKILLFLCAALISGCSSYVPKNEINDVNQVSNIERDNKDSSNKKLEFNSESWWEIYNDNNLNQLIELSISENSDIKVAKLNIDKAAATVNAAKESGFRAGLYAKGGYSQMAKKMTNAKTIPTPLGGVSPKDHVGKPTYTASMGLQASYTFDFYHKFRNLGKQQAYLAEAVAFQSKLIKLKISTTVTKLYGLYGYLDKVNVNLEARLKTLTELEGQVKKSIEYGVGVEDSLLDIQDKIFELKQYINMNNFRKTSALNTINAISSYKHRDEIARLLEAGKDNVIIDKELVVPETISSDVIVNRPDVQYYQMMIKSEKSKLAAAKVDFYPQVSIGGDIGYKALGLDNSFKDFRSLMWSFGPRVYLPLFNLSGVKTNYKIAGIQVNIFVEDYNKTINNSIKDINNQLTATQMAKLNTLNQEEKFKLRKKMYDNSLKRYKYGSTSKFKTLNSKYNYLSAELEMEEQRYKLFVSQVALINSLGGVYKSNEEVRKTGEAQ